MSKLRVYELAKELNKTNKEMLAMLKEKGIEVASHMSTLSDEQLYALAYDQGDCYELLVSSSEENIY